MVSLRQTATELHLYVPPSHKERAKAIEGRRWDPQRKCWVYPRSRRVYDAIIAEFGDELQPSVSAHSPEGRGSNGHKDQAEGGLAEELAAIRAMLEQLNRNPASSADQLDVLLATRELEIGHLRSQLQERQEEIHRLSAEVAQTREQLTTERLEREAARHAAPAQKRTTANEDHQRFVLYLKNMAIAASGRNEQFSRLVEELRAKDLFPVRVRKELEHALCQALNVEDKSLDLVGLLNLARDHNLLTPEEANIAHLLRIQGNVMAHAQPDADTLWARCLLSLFGAALLWPAITMSDRYHSTG